MKLSSYILDFFLNEDEGDFDITVGLFKGVTNKQFKEFLNNNKEMFNLKNEKRTFNEIVFLKDNIPIVTKAAQKAGLKVETDSGGHTIVNVDSKPKVLKIRSTGKITSNSWGKKLADAAELATIEYLKKEFTNAADSGQRFFIDHPELFLTWVHTFKETKKVVKTIIKSDISKFDIVHDGTKEGVARIIADIAKKGKITKDAWNPADMYLVNSSARREVESKLREVCENSDDSVLLNACASIWELYNEKKLYPISLKKISGKEAKFELCNVPGGDVIPMYDVVPKKFILNLKLDTKEIGAFNFEDSTSGKLYNMQYRPFPIKWSNNQMEIKIQGEKARLAKTPADMIEKIMKEHGSTKIKANEHFGKSGDSYFTKIGEQTIKEYYEWYKFCAGKKYVDAVKTSLSEFVSIFSSAKTNSNNAISLCSKIQGLNMMYFLCKNDRDISSIMTEFINGAKKIRNDNAFFIKIY